jgi:hypothetical protein
MRAEYLFDNTGSCSDIGINYNMMKEKKSSEFWRIFKPEYEIQHRASNQRENPVKL